MAETTEETPKGGGQDKAVRYWKGEIQQAKTRLRDWHKRARAVLDRYCDERDSMAQDVRAARVNILWANTEILKASLYGQSAKPDVRRRFPDRSNKAARAAAEVLERAIAYTCDQYDFDGSVELAVEDSLLPGAGILWVRYEPELDDTGEIYSQQVEVDHVYWADFLWGMAREWRDAPWVARRHILTKTQVKRAWPGHEEKIPFDYIEGGDEKSDKKEENKDSKQRAEVWEVWDKETKARLYVVEGYDEILQEDEDPYILRNFFPCAQPLVYTHKPGSLTPIPEYTMYQDQANLVDELETRKFKLTNALKRRGVYDATAHDVESMVGTLADASDNQFIPVKSFAQYRERGGQGNILDAVFATENIQPIAAVLGNVEQQQALAIQKIYEITGISDIIRGASDPNETATAQRIKGQFGSLRLQKRQKVVQRFIREVFRIKGELIAEHYTEAMLAQITGMEMPTTEQVQQAEMALAGLDEQLAALPPPMPPQEGQEQAPDPSEQQRGAMEAQKKEIEDVLNGPTWPQVMEILRSDERRGYAIDIETDSTILVDEAADKEARNEFGGVMNQLFTLVPTVMQQFPQALPLVKETSMFIVRGYHAGRVLEETIEDAFDELIEATSGGQPEQPDPEAEKLQAEAARAEAEMELKREEMQLRATEMTEKLSLERERAESERDLKQTDMTFQHGMAERNFKLKMAETVATIKKDRDTGQIDAILKAADIKTTQEKVKADVATKAADIALKAEESRQRADERAQDRDMDAMVEVNL